jgi:hypothetical protein
VRGDKSKHLVKAGDLHGPMENPFVESYMGR